MNRFYDNVDLYGIFLFLLLIHGASSILIHKKRCDTIEYQKNVLVLQLMQISRFMKIQLMNRRKNIKSSVHFTNFCDEINTKSNMNKMFYLTSKNLDLNKWNERLRHEKDFKLLGIDFDSTFSEKISLNFWRTINPDLNIRYTISYSILKFHNFVPSFSLILVTIIQCFKLSCLTRCIEKEWIYFYYSCFFKQFGFLIRFRKSLQLTELFWILIRAVNWWK